jgi:hypothetical protein
MIFIILLKSLLVSFSLLHWQIIRIKWRFSTMRQRTKKIILTPLHHRHDAHRSEWDYYYYFFCVLLLIVMYARNKFCKVKNAGGEWHVHKMNIMKKVCCLMQMERICMEFNEIFRTFSSFTSSQPFHLEMKRALRNETVAQTLCVELNSMKLQLHKDWEILCGAIFIFIRFVNPHYNKEQSHSDSRNVNVVRK